MRATHTDYKHPRHLRVEEGKNVWCMAPSCSEYAKLNKSNLPKWEPEKESNHVHEE
jgi:hypothetical protein